MNEATHIPAPPPAFNFRHAGKLYRLQLSARFVCAVEDEMGALGTLARRFAKGDWRISEIITLMQMFLQQSGECVDYYTLGDALLAEGFSAPLSTVQRFFACLPDSACAAPRRPPASTTPALHRQRIKP